MEEIEKFMEIRKMHPAPFKLAKAHQKAAEGEKKEEQVKPDPVANEKAEK